MSKADFHNAPQQGPPQGYPQQGPPQAHPQQQATRFQQNTKLQSSFAKEIRIEKGGSYEGMMDSFGECFGTCGTIVPCCPNPYRQVEQVTFTLTTGSCRVVIPVRQVL